MVMESSLAKSMRTVLGRPALASVGAFAFLLLLCGASAPGRSADSPPAERATVAGSVRDAQGQPIEGARIVLAEFGLDATTGGNGEFSFAPVPAGRYQLLVQRVGYAPLLRAVDLRRSLTLTLTLTETPFRLPAVNVTATRSPIQPFASPLPTSELRPDRLERAQGVSLAQALQSLPGVRALSSGEQIGKPVIRGLSGARVLVLENGSPLEDYSWSDEDGPSVDVRLAQRVEVIRGPASVLYGSDALGGVVNVLPARLPSAQGQRPFTRTGLELYGASNNAQFGAGVRVEGAHERLGWRLFGIGRHASDLHTPQGEVPNTGYGALNGEAAVGLQGDRANATLRYSHYGGEFKLLEAGGPPPSTGGAHEEGGPERKLSDDRVQIVGNLLRGIWRFEGKAQWQRHSLIELSDEFGQSTSPATVTINKAEQTETTAFDLLLNTESIDLLAHHAKGEHLSGTLGVSGVYQSNDTRGPEPLVPDAHVSSGAAFAFEQLVMGQWTLLAGARGGLPPTSSCSRTGPRSASNAGSWGIRASRPRPASTSTGASAGNAAACAGRRPSIAIVSTTTSSPRHGVTAAAGCPCS
jgi:iron complex outermembrane receptor protein